MMNEVIIDTNVMVGLYDEKDQWHEQAKKLIQGLKKASKELVLLDCVANETFTVLARRLKERNRLKAMVPTLKKVKAVFSKDKIAKSYRLLETNYEEVVNRVIESKGELNFHDALIVVFALNKDISFIASFDQDFKTISGITLFSDPADVI